jgi:hypothetical protein
MSFDKFFDLLMMVYITILHVLQRLSIIHALISEIIQDAHARGMVVGMEALAGSTIHPEPNPRRGSDQKQSPLGPRTRRKTLDDDDDLDVGVLDTQSLETNEWSKNNAIVSTTVERGSVFESLMMESANVLASACDLAHVRCAKLIGVRSDQNAMLNPIDFYRLFGATWDFVNGAESITGRVCFGLKGTMVSQVRWAFLFSAILSYKA